MDTALFQSGVSKVLRLRYLSVIFGGDKITLFYLKIKVMVSRLYGVLFFLSIVSKSPRGEARKGGKKG
jgi:hypothetical protein